MSELTYAKVGGPPDDWECWVVLDAESGEELTNLVEVNTREGWAVRYVTPPVAGPSGDLLTERITGKFRLARRD